MAVFTELDFPTLESCLQPYNIGRLLAFHPAQDGIENTNYFISTEGSGTRHSQQKDYVYTIIEEGGGDLEARTAMVKLLDHVQTQGLCVPKVIRTKTGDAETICQGKSAILCSKLQGNHVWYPVTDQCAAIGRFLARLHLMSADIAREFRPYWRDVDWFHEHSATVKESLSLRHRLQLARAISAIESLLDRNDTQALPESVIHGDLFRDNALFNEYGLSGIVDFHHAMRGFQIYDLAVAVNDWCRDELELVERRVWSLTYAYHEIRPLSLTEIWLFPIFLLYAATAFWVSRLIVSVRDDLSDDHPIKDPEEFAALVEQHLDHPFRLNEEEFRSTVDQHSQGI